MRVDFFVTPLDIGSGTALPATITYKRQEGASETQARKHHFCSTVCHSVCKAAACHHHQDMRV